MSDIERAARSLIGARFRLHGRDPANGLDCVGLVAAATGVAAPTGYALRGGDPGLVARHLAAAGFHEAGTPAPGDVLLLRPGPGQLHLAIATRAGVVHADAGLRRIVERPGATEWEVIGIWRRLS